MAKNESSNRKAVVGVQVRDVKSNIYPYPPRFSLIFLNGYSSVKRALDFVVAFSVLILSSPILAIVALLIKLDSHGPVFFKQERIGKGFQPFFIYKFRTMAREIHHKGGLITIGNDPRITRIGRYLRKTKIDEIPQLINVLTGDMSIVGPRPEVRKYVKMFREDYMEILKIQPGLSDLASIKYRNESEILANSKNPEEEYIKRILPDKVRLNKKYVRCSSFLFDLRLAVLTIWSLVSFDSLVKYYRGSAKSKMRNIDLELFNKSELEVD